jgi:uncharacterized protein (DUF2126 family)
VPLVFDIVDRWKESSISRCTYHVESPESRAYTARPSNATEAAERRRERFQKSSTMPLPMVAPEEESNPLFPMTLDLRLPPPGRETHIEKPGLVS